MKAKNIIITGLVAELVAIATALISSYRTQLIFEDLLTEVSWGINECLNNMLDEFVQFWPVFVLILLATVVALIVSFVFFNKNSK